MGIRPTNKNKANQMPIGHPLALWLEPAPLRVCPNILTVPQEPDRKATCLLRQRLLETLSTTATYLGYTSQAETLKLSCALLVITLIDIPTRKQVRGSRSGSDPRLLRNRCTLSCTHQRPP